ncbi:MAG: hypothetical protein JW809_03215 [Pirellulales bacterium]|nr:hypothetical protein [Pirellulales bacterium]
MPPRTRQVVRKVDPRLVADFDDQLWPINCAILILAGFASGIAIATGDWRAENLLYNTVFRLAMVALALGAALVAVVFLQGRVVRRVQLCVLVSLLVHLALGLFFHQQYIKLMAAWREADAARPIEKDDPRLVVPDYHWENIERPESRHTFEEPVEVEAPKPTDPEPIAPRPVEHDVPLEKTPTVEPASPRPQQPDPVEIHRAEPTAPRRAQLAAGAQISRQEWKRRPEPNEPMNEPEAIQPAATAPENLRADVAAPARRATDPAKPRREASETAPSATRPQEAAALARTERAEEPLVDQPTAPGLDRRPRNPTDLAQAEPADAPPAPAAASPNEQVLSPAERRATEAAKSGARESVPERVLAADESSIPPGNASVVRALAVVRSEQSVATPDLSGQTAATQPGTLARSAAGVDVPSAVLATSEPARTPAPAGGVPGSVLEAVGELPIARAAAVAPRGAKSSSSGEAVLTVGSKDAVARQGIARAAGHQRRRLAAETSTVHVERSQASGIAALAPPFESPMPAGPGAPAASEGTASRLTANSSATAALRGGSPSVAAQRPSVGSGPVTAGSGSPDQIGAAQLARVTRHESVSSAISAGGTPSPTRQLGKIVAPAGTVDAPQIAAAAPSEGRPGGAPLEARTDHQRQGQPGLPSGQSGEAREGAIASLQTEGQPLAAVAGSRAEASERDATGGGTGPAASATLARADRGVRVPMGVVGAENLPEPGAGGVPSGTGEAASRLEVGSMAAGSPPSDAASGSIGFERAHGVSSGDMARDLAQTQPRAGGAVGTTPGATAGPRRLPRGDEPGPTLAAPSSGGPLRRTNTAGLPRGLANTLGQEPAAVSGPVEGPGQITLTAGLEEAAPTRRAGGLPVQIAAKLGPGGLSYEASAQVGIPSHRARPESEVVHALSRRFLVEQSGGRLAVDGRAHDLPTEAYRQRDPGLRARAVEIYGGTEGTERAVEMGLEFLVRCQFADGRWSLSELPAGAPAGDDPALGSMESDTAATGLALLSFFGAGYTHQSDKHRATVRRGLEWLLANQKPDGDLFTGGTNYARLYSHGIAAIALCEAYGMTRDPQLREPAQRAIRFIIEAQHPTRGGWRYEPRTESDTSVSGWQLMALKSAQMAGLAVPEETLRRVSAWLDSAQADGGTRYIYNPHAGDTPEQRAGRVPNLAMTAEGTLMRMYLGWSSQHAALVGAANHLKANLPQAAANGANARDAYYWYYATQVMFQMQGDYWEAWNNRLHPLLESSQAQTGPMAGSWHPARPVRDRWGHAGGRIYVTAMNLLMLEVYYRHLPLFQTLEP